MKKQSWLEGIEKLERNITAIIFAIMVICIFIQVLNRSFFKLSSPWTEELARYCMVWMVMLGTEMGLRDGSQISIDIFTKNLNKRIVKGVKVFSKIMVIIFSIVVFYFSITILTTQIQTKQLSAAMEIPMYIPYLSITLGFLIISLVQIVVLIKMIGCNDEEVRN